MLKKVFIPLSVDKMVPFEYCQRVEKVYQDVNRM